jgi:hypothetical protein
MMKRVLIVLLLVVFVLSIFGNVSAATLKTLTPVPAETQTSLPKIIPKSAASPAAECGSVPTDGCKISTPGVVTFATQIYNLPSGIQISSNDVVLDCNGATLIGNNDPNMAGVREYNTNPPYPQINITIKNCIFNNYFYGIYNSFSNQVVVKNNTFKNILRDGIYNGGSCNISVVGNSFRDIMNGNSGVAIEYDSAPYYNEVYQGCTYSISVENNTIQDSYRGMQILPIDFVNYPIFIGNNIFYNLSAGGLRLQSTNLPVKIYNNVFNNNNYWGIGLYQWYSGTNISNIEIYNNTFYDNPSWHGVYIQPYSGSEQNISIHHNSFNQLSTGIYFNGRGYSFSTSDIKIYRNIITNNYVGIAQYDTPGLMVYSNNITNNYAGLDIQGNINTPNPSGYFLNNIYGNSFVNAFGDAAQEISYQKIGNYWWHASGKCFIAGQDSNRIDVNDSYAYCGSAPSTAVLIPIPSSGWYFFGSNGRPRNISITKVLNGIVGNPSDPNFAIVQYYLNGTRKQYDPLLPLSSPVNSLKDILPWYGYWTKFNIAPFGNNFVIASDKVAGSSPLALNVNQHWIGYWCDSNKPTAAALTSLAGNYVNIKTYENGAWKTYDPALPQFSDLLEMKPGNAYLIKMSNSDSLDYLC